MKERTGLVRMGDRPLTLVGKEVKKGDRAPEFDVVDKDLIPVHSSTFPDTVQILSTVPSLDTPVCDTQTRRFNEALTKLSEEVEILTISMDLPFAQKRWCGAAGLNRVKTFSDHQKASFGQAFGVLIKELRLLARAVFVVDKGGVIQYMQIVEDLTNEPDYDAALDAAERCIS